MIGRVGRGNINHDDIRFNIELKLGCAKGSIPDRTIKCHFAVVFVGQLGCKADIGASIGREPRIEAIAILVCGEDDAALYVGNGDVGDSGGIPNAYNCVVDRRVGLCGFGSDVVISGVNARVLPQNPVTLVLCEPCQRTIKFAKLKITY
jgi:hypothetical protein